MSDHAQNLRQAAEEIRREGHAGWGNACEWAADEIERLTAALRAQPGPVSIDDMEWAGKVHLAEAIRERDELRRQLAEANVTDRDDENVLAAGVVLLIIVVMIVAGLVLIW